MSFLEITNLDKSFGKSEILKDINLKLEQHHVLSLLGSSGSGKTTLLKIIAGLEQQDNGEILLKSEEISQIKPQRRNIVYLYQESLLFPHLNAFENIAFGMKIQKKDKAEIDEKVHSMFDKLGMQGHKKKMANELSGGQRQRVSFGRAMVIEPSLLLLDEPFGALDTITRQKMQELFKEMAAAMQTTAIFVTHDLKEAIIMADDIGKITHGTLTQYDNLEQFAADAASGVEREAAFWKQFST